MFKIFKLANIPIIGILFFYSTIFPRPIVKEFFLKSFFSKNLTINKGKNGIYSQERTIRL